MALISTLTDTFDDNSKGAQWGANGNPFGAATTGVTVSETGQRLEVTPASSQSTEFTSGYVSDANYELTASAAFVRLIQPTDVGTPAYTYFRITDGGGAGVGFDIEAGRVLCREGANTLSDTAYSAADHAWLRVRESGGTVFWDRAPSTASNPPAPGDWVNITSTGSFATGTASVKAYIGAGTYSSVASPGTAIFDGFNTGTADTGPAPNQQQRIGSLLHLLAAA